MKTIKTLVLFLFLINLSCSKSDDTQEEQNSPGSVSIAFTNGGGFVMENIKATVSNDYTSSNKLTVNITGSAEGSSGGSFTMSIVDNDDNFSALAKDNSIPFGNTTKSFYATARYTSNSIDFEGLTGTLDVTKYEENTNSKTALLNATFSPSNGSGVIMLGTISGLVLRCTSCN